MCEILNSDYVKRTGKSIATMNQIFIHQLSIINFNDMRHIVGCRGLGQLGGLALVL